MGTRSRVGTRQMRRLAFLQMVMSREYLATHDRNEVAQRLAPLFGHDLGDTPPIVMQQLGALRRFDAAVQLKNLASLPTLVVSAAEDVIFPPHYGRTLAANIPGASFSEFPNAAHGVGIECADAVNTALAQHIEAACFSQ